MKICINLQRIGAFRRKYANVLSDSPLNWKIIDDKNGIVKFERGELKAIFNIGERAAYFVADDVIFSNLVDGKKMYCNMVL